MFPEVDWSSKTYYPGQWWVLRRTGTNKRIKLWWMWVTTGKRHYFCNIPRISMIAAKSIPLLIGHSGFSLLLFGTSIPYHLLVPTNMIWSMKILNFIIFFLNLGDKLCYIYYKRARILFVFLFFLLLIKYSVHMVDKFVSWSHIILKRIYGIFFFKLVHI